MADICNFEDAYVTQYFTEFMRVYKLQGKGPANRVLQDIGPTYKPILIRKIKEELTK